MEGVSPSSVASFLVLGGQDPAMYRQKNICTYIARASEASERLRNIYFHDSKYICIVIYNAVSFNYLLYGAIGPKPLFRHNWKFTKMRNKVFATGFILIPMQEAYIQVVFEKYEHIILLRNTGVTIYITGCKFPYVTYVTLVIISQTLQD